MNCNEVRPLLHDIADGVATPEAELDVRRHLDRCQECSKYLAFIRTLKADAAALPKSVPPPEDLLGGILERIGEKPVTVSPAHERRRHVAADRTPRSGRGLSRIRRPLSFAFAGIAAILLIGIAWRMTNVIPSWNVSTIEGELIIDNRAVSGGTKLRKGGWLETGSMARAKIVVGEIGEVEVGPNSRLRLLAAADTDHRVELSKGTIHATIWAPPRLFFVETPSATAIDLGCVYTLTVDESGASLLDVTAGIVALAHEGRESLVPAGAACETRPGQGPGTPYRRTASGDFRTALAAFDFNGDTSALDGVLRSARREDAITLWHLLQRTDDAGRKEVFATLYSLSPAPDGVTREGVLQNNKEMINRWGEELGLMFY